MELRSRFLCLLFLTFTSNAISSTNVPSGPTRTVGTTNVPYVPTSTMGSTNAPSVQPSTVGSSNAPSVQPSTVGFSNAPSVQPSTVGSSNAPSVQPSTVGSSNAPSVQPSTVGFSNAPSVQPSTVGSSNAPSVQPSTVGSSNAPSVQPSTVGFSNAPSVQPSTVGSSNAPSVQPSTVGSSNAPSVQPSTVGSSNAPSVQPSTVGSSNAPSVQPSTVGSTNAPSVQPSTVTNAPSVQPSTVSSTNAPVIQTTNSSNSKPSTPNPTTTNLGKQTTPTKDTTGTNLSNILNMLGQNTSGLNSILGMLGIQPSGIANILNGLGVGNGQADLSGLLQQLTGGGQGGTANLGNLQGLLQALPLLLSSYGISTDCSRDVLIMLQGVMERKMWAIQMLDSMGKLPSGVLTNIETKWLGDWDECRNTEVVTYSNDTLKTDPKVAFTPKYCVTVIPLENIAPPAFQYAPGGANIYAGTCVPNKCSKDDMNRIYYALLTAIFNGTQPLNLYVAKCSEDRKLETDAIAVICFLAILGMFIFFGTLYDIVAIQMHTETVDTNTGAVLLTRHVNGTDPPPAYTNNGYAVTEQKETIQEMETKFPAANGVDPANVTVQLPNDVTRQQALKPHTPERSTLAKILLSFSAYTNAVKILSTDQGAGSLGAINGIRFLSMAWVILGHTYFFSMGYSANLFSHFGKKTEQWTFASIMYATVSVDSFFALSGVLVAYLTLREMKKVKGARKFNWFMFYFHRFWRLTPPYMLVIMFGTVILPYMFDGPMWPEEDIPSMASCREYWWTNLLYINNYVHVDKICLGWSWYLANDMQFYILSPLVLVLLYYNVVLGSILSMAAIIGSSIWAGIVNNNHHYPIQRFSPFSPRPDDNQYEKYIYFPSYARAGPYVVGLFTGYILYKYKTCRVPKVVNLLGWFICLAICCLVIYSPYTKADSHIMSQDESTAYVALHRTAWGLAVCWMIFSCARGYGGWINQILSWKAFIPLGRLTYCAYLVHPLVMNAYFGSRKRSTYWSDMDAIYLFISNLVMSYGVAFITSLVFESPMMGLEKAIFGKLKKK